MATLVAPAHDDQIIVKKEDFLPSLVKVAASQVRVLLWPDDRSLTLLHDWESLAINYVEAVVGTISFQGDGDERIFDRAEYKAIEKALKDVIGNIGPIKRFSTVQKLPWLAYMAEELEGERSLLSEHTTECSEVLLLGELFTIRHTVYDAIDLPNVSARENVAKMKRYVAHRHERSPDSVSVNRLFHATQRAWEEASRAWDQRLLFKDLGELDTHIEGVPAHHLAEILDENCAYVNQVLADEKHPWAREQGETRLAKPNPSYGSIGLALVYENHRLGHGFTSELVVGLERPASAASPREHGSQRPGVSMSLRKRKIYRL